MEGITHGTVSLSTQVLIIILVAMLFFYGGLALISRGARRAIEAGMRRQEWHRKDIEKRQKTLIGLFKNIWRVLVISVGATAIFVKLFPDTNLAPLFASAGIVGVALGFGAQSLVKDFLSGIFIISENQYRVGDIIEIDGASGTVERIGARSTVMRDADGNVHYYPNGMIQHVVNKTMGYSMARFSISVNTADNLDELIDIINTTGKELSEEAKWKHKILEPPAFVSVGEFTSTSVNLLISGKTQPSDQWSVIAEMRRRLLLEFEEKHIGLSLTIPSEISSKKKK